LESLAAGTPIIASRGTPWREVEASECGKWVENNIENLVPAIINTLNNDRLEMRVNSRKLAIKYDWKNIALKFLDVYKKIINE